MAETSNPTMKVHVIWECGCGRNFTQKYADTRPEIGAGEECPLHGETWIASYTAVGK